jgi:hypothetical protein
MLTMSHDITGQRNANQLHENYRSFVLFTCAILGNLKLPLLFDFPMHYHHYSGLVQLHSIYQQNRARHLQFVIQTVTSSLESYSVFKILPVFNRQWENQT